MRTAVLDYGAGNLASVLRGLKVADLNPFITREPREILAADAVVLPGVGAFARAMDNLREVGLVPVIKEVAARGTPFLGICLGMQLLFEESEEHGLHQGLGLLPGRVRRFPPGFKIPHMGWNSLDSLQGTGVLKGIAPGSYVYFVHSYYVTDYEKSQLAASTNYGVEFPSVVCFNNIVGIQFHPEKSSAVGLKILSNFRELVKNVSDPGYRS